MMLVGMSPESFAAAARIAATCRVRTHRISDIEPDAWCVVPPSRSRKTHHGKRTALLAALARLTA